MRIGAHYRIERIFPIYLLVQTLTVAKYATMENEQ